MSISLYTPRQLMGILEEKKEPRMWLTKTFFGQEKTHASKSVDIDIVKGKRRLAPFVAPTGQGKLIERIGYSTNSYTPPYIKPKMVQTPEEFEDRIAGETIYEAGAKTNAQRALEQVAKDLAELDDIIDRREENMVADALFNGQVSVSGDGVSDTISYGRDSNHSITNTGNDLWTDKTNSDPMAQLRADKRLITKATGLTPRVAVMGTDAIDALLAHTGVRDALDTRRIDLGMINPQELPDGVTYWGYLKDPGIDIYTYEEWYLNDSAEETAIVPAKKVLLGATTAMSIRHYAMIRDLKANYVTKRFAKMWEVEDPSSRHLLVQSAPLPVTHQPDAFVVRQVVA